jgi:hypothetical protein
MTALATYDDLVTEAQDWLFNRSDIASKVPTFVRMFEAKMNRKLFVRQMEQRSTTTIRLDTAQPEFVSVPLDFQSMRRIRLLDTPGEPRRLKFATGAQIETLRENECAVPGIPVWFSISGDEIELAPTPTFAYTIEMIYRRTIAPLGPTNQYNWLYQQAPDLYLYGTLMEAAPYLHEDERIPTWAAGVQGGIDDLNKLSQEALYNAGPLTVRRRGGY